MGAYRMPIALASHYNLSNKVSEYLVTSIKHWIMMEGHQSACFSKLLLDNCVSPLFASSLVVRVDWKRESALSISINHVLILVLILITDKCHG
jgi:hypothetical protein